MASNCYCERCVYYLPWYDSIEDVDMCCASGAWLEIKEIVLSCDDRKVR